MPDNDKSTKKPGRIYLFYGIVFFAFFLVLYFPAARAYVLLEERLPAHTRQVRLTGIEGPWFAGSAREGRLGNFAVRQINWKVQPALSGLFQTALSFHSKEEGYFKAVITVSPGGDTIRCSNVRAQLPLELLNKILVRYNMKVAGSVSLAVDHLLLKEGYLIEGEGAMLLSHVRSLDPRNISLGVFKIELTSRDREIIISIKDSGGPLALEGILHLQNDGSYSFSGIFAAREKKDPELESFLKFIGPPGEDGAVKVSYSDRLRPLFSYL